MPRVDRTAHPISMPSMPYYPEAARQRNQERAVVLNLRVLRDGTVEEVTLERSSGFSALDDGAMKTNHESTWAPAVTADGETVDSIVVFPMVYKLKD